MNACSHCGGPRKPRNAYCSRRCRNLALTERRRQSHGGLTATEYRIVKAIRDGGGAGSYADIFAELGFMDGDNQSNRVALRVHVNNIRRKGITIEACRGYGYVFGRSLIPLLAVPEPAFPPVPLQEILLHYAEAAQALRWPPAVTDEETRRWFRFRQRRAS